MRTEVPHRILEQDRPSLSLPRNRRRGAGLPVALAAASVLLLLAMSPGTAGAKSLYVITSIVMSPIPIHAYDVSLDGTLTFQGRYDAPFYGTGMVGLALDSESGYLFGTYEDYGDILIVDATTLEGKGRIHAPNSENLAGIVYDHDKRLVYCMDRRTPKLYAFQWDAAALRLTSAVGSPFALEGAMGYGIALDEINDLLYVASVSQGISVYSTLDWRLVRTLPTGDSMTSVAVDPHRGYLYYGAGYFGNLYLTQRSLTNDTKREILVDPDAGVVGLAVDLETGYVYVTTGRDGLPGGDDLIVYNDNLEVIQVIEDIGNPTGMAIPSRSVSVNPLHLTKVVENSLGGAPDSQGLYRVVIGDEVTYSITFDDGGYNLTEVSVVDELPAQVEFISATGDGACGRYDAAGHRYVWQNPPLSAGATTRLDLVGRVRSSTLPDQIITNSVTIDSDKTPATTVSARAVATNATGNPLNLRKSVVFSENLTTDGTNLYVRPGDQITYRISFDNATNDRMVSNVTVVDVLSPYVEFVSATDHGLTGMYDPATRTYSWSYSSLAAGEARSVDLAVRVAANVSPGVIIPNTVTISGSSTPAVSKKVSITVAFTPLELDLVVVSPSGETDDRDRPYVGTNEDVTYEIRFRNPSAVAVTDLRIVDELPQEVDVVASASDFGTYDRTAGTYTWSYPMLAPGTQATLKLVLRVKDQVPSGTVISNVAMISSQQTAPSRDRADVTVRPGGVEPEPPAGEIRARMFLKPTRISRSQSLTASDLMVVVHLPEGYGKELILNQPLLMTPGSVRSTDTRVFGTSTQGKVMCLFDPAPMLAAIKGNGMFVLKVTGNLQGGSTFVCEETVTIVP